MFGDPWKVVRTYRNIDVYDVPENELGNDGADEQAGYAFQEHIGEMDHIIQEGDEDELEFILTIGLTKWNELMLAFSVTLQRKITMNM
jgi:hypothetical protein